VDQAAPPHQGILRNLRECGEDTNLDRISVYVLVAIVKKRLNLPRSLYENLQILSLTLCEQMPLDELLAQIDIDQNPSEAHNR